MNSKLTLVLITALVLLVGGDARMAFPKARPERIAAQQNKSAPSATAKNKTAPASGCSLLTPAMLEKVLGKPFKDVSAGHKMPPAYNGAWGSFCEYGSTGTRPDQSVRVDFLVFMEASAAAAKQAFDGTTMFYVDNSKAKPSIGDSAYWETVSDKQEPSIHVLKGKVHFKIGMVPQNEKQLRDLAALVAAGI
jgi:hypothetical protein